jgi:uncharacterized protein involved in exopolysaccharide biosynthesis
MNTFLTPLFRRKWLIVSVFLLVMLGVVAFTALSPRIYESRTMVLVTHERADLVVSPDASNAVAQSAVSEADVNSEIELLSSHEMLREIVIANKLEAAENRPNREGGIELAIRRLSKDLVVKPVRKASIIQITYRSRNAAQSAEVLRTLAALYFEMYLKVHRTSGTYAFFKEEADKNASQLSVAQNRLTDFQRRTGIVLIQEQKQMMLRHIMDTEAELDETRASIEQARGRRATLERQLDTVPARVLTQSRVVPNEYSVERLQTMLAELRNRRTELVTNLRPEDRLVREVDQKITDTSAALKHAQDLTAVEQTTDANPLHKNLEDEHLQNELALPGLEAKKAYLTDSLASWRSRVEGLDRAGSVNDALTREVSQAENNLVLYTKKQEEARIADSLDRQKFANISIVENPVEPFLPIKPNVPFNLGIGFLLACVTSLGAAFALEMSRSFVETPQELEARAPFPVMAIVPVEGM